MIAAWFAVARADVAFESALEQGVETVVAVGRDGEPEGGVTVRVVTRPGLAGSREIAVGITDGRGRVKWTPETSGLTVVRAGDESVSVLVRASEPPAATLALLGVVALAALGFLGVGVSGRR